MYQPNIQVVAINDLTDAATLKHLFKYDSVHGVYKGSIAVKDSYLQIEDQKIQILSERDPENLPWKELDIDLVIESTGIFITREGAKKQFEKKYGSDDGDAKFLKALQKKLQKEEDVKMGRGKRQ